MINMWFYGKYVTKKLQLGWSISFINFYDFGKKIQDSAETIYKM